MDIEKIRKLAEENFEAGKLMKAVTEVKNELKDKEQMRDVVMSDHFKTLREPLIEQQKKHEKQDKVIEQLQKNQRAITSGFEDLSLLQQLPETPTQSSKLPVDYSPAMMEKSPKLRSNLDGGFTPDEMQTLMEYNLYTPSDVLAGVKDKKLDWDNYNGQITKLLKQIGREKKVAYQRVLKRGRKTLKKLTN